MNYLLNEYRKPLKEHQKNICFADSLKQLESTFFEFQSKYQIQATLFFHF